MTCRLSPVNRDAQPLCYRIAIGLAFWAAVSLTLATGCASYQMGTDTLYRPEIQTVSVPVFQSESFRKHLGERLTEAVVKEIELKTPYKVVQSQRADSQLTGRLLSDSKYAITENRNDELRDIELNYHVEVTWHDRNGASLFEPQAIPLPTPLIEVAQSVHFVPEGGQSLGTASQDAIERLAEQIVARMELPW